jgi:hypothetical protein
MFKRIAIEKPSGFDEKLASFVDGCQEICDQYMERNGFNWKMQITADQVAGSRYVRVVSMDHGSRSCHCFVDKTNGDVLKSAGWKAPAAGARGNIFDSKNGLGRNGRSWD